jgi:hypothetical protein
MYKTASNVKVRALDAAEDPVPVLSDWAAGR